MKNLLIKKNNNLSFLIISILTITACIAFCKLFFPNPVFIFNYAPFTVISSSMEPQYPVYSVVIIKKEPFSSLKTGDVIVYKSDALGGGLAFHRIMRITGEGIFTKGDNNNHEDNQLITQKSYVGKGVARFVFFARFLALIHSPSGFILFFLLPVTAALLLYQSLKLFKNSKNTI